MIKGLTYAILTTPDVARARAFYTDKLGLATEDDAPTFSQFTTRDGTPWAIMAPDEGQPRVDVLLFLAVDDVDATYAAWQSRGVETLGEPHTEPFGRTFAFRDPDGRVLNAWEPAQQPA